MNYIAVLVINDLIYLDEIPTQVPYQGHLLHLTKVHFLQGELQEDIDSSFLNFLNNEDGALFVTGGFTTAILK